MADNIIQVNVTANKPKSVTVSSANVGTEITASSDTGRFWAQTSKNWAVSEAIVDNTDYSSKYYANKSKESASTAQNISESVKSDYNEFLTASLNANEQLQTGKEEALTSLESARAEAENSINNTKTTAISDIEFVADGEKQEIQGLVDDEKEEIKDLINTGKEELKESIGDVKVLTTLEIGDIGIAPLGIDETKGKRRYLNGQLIIQEQYVQFTNKVKSAVALYPSLACTESEWQTTATMTVGGQVGKFVVDDNAGTIRLPKIIMPIQGLTDLSKLGEIVDAGLPNIEGTFGAWMDSAGGAFGNKASHGSIKVASGNATSLTHYTKDFNASRSSSIYSNSDTVQQEQIQYPYFIQVATGAETEDNIINEIELNNPFSLLDYKYSEYELNNLSWLRSQGQYNSKAIYPAVYDLLLKIYNGTETKAGVSVKLSTETFTDYDFVLNTAEEAFRLPIKVKLASGKAVMGNGMALGFTNGSINMGASFNDYNGSYFIKLSPENYGQEIGLASGEQSGFKKTVGITTDPTKSGIETSDSGLYLYFYVGETVQNANLINAGRIEEKLVDKVDKAYLETELVPLKTAYIVEAYVNGTSGYNLYSNNYCEQWGFLASTSNASTTIKYVKAFANTNYNLVVSMSASGTPNVNVGWQTKTTTSFVAYTYQQKNNPEGTHWRACGYIA